MNAAIAAKRVCRRCAVAASIILALLATSPMLHAETAVEAVLSTNTIHVGDRVTLDVTIRHGNEERPVIPHLSREPFIAVWDVQTSPPVIKDNQSETTSRITLTSFVVGEHRISTNGIVLLKTGGQEESLAFPEMVLRVVSILTNPPPSLADIKPVATLPGHPWLRILAMILVVAMIAILAAWIFRHWKRKPKQEMPTRNLPPHEIALTALQALLKRGYIENGQSEPFYVELSAIVRIYLEERFDLRAPEQTTEEFIRSSSQSTVLSMEHRALAQEFLEQSDLVKFARFEPTATDMRNAWDAAARLVRETIPAPVNHPRGGP